MQRLEVSCAVRHVVSRLRVKLVFPFVQLLFMKILFVAERYIHRPIFGLGYK
jgi:hypothetical protein